jgi:hypothetical protein
MFVYDRAGHAESGAHARPRASVVAEGVPSNHVPNWISAMVAQMPEVIIEIKMDRLRCLVPRSSPSSPNPLYIHLGPLS